MPAYISEVFHNGQIQNDFIEVAVTTGTDMSGYSIVIYDETGVVSTTLPLGNVVSTVAGKDVYVVDDATAGFPGLGNKDGIAVVDDTGTVVQFITFNDNAITATEGPAAGLSATNIGYADNGSSYETNDGGASYFSQATVNRGTIPCYAGGTLIDTPDGPRVVETLAPGDLVETLDHGPMPVRYVRKSTQPLEGIETDAHPILICAGALGPGRPELDLVVSPQHRILVGGAGQLDGCFDGQCFAPAKALTGLPRIRRMMGKREVTWVHFALDAHEVITAGGCLSESLLLGPMVVNRLSRLQRLALYQIYGKPSEPGAPLNGPAARDCLRVGAVRRCLEAHAREASQHVA